MKNLYMILPLALILCFMVGCQDKDAMAELEAMKAQAEVEEQNKEIVLKWFQEADKGDLNTLLPLADETWATDFIGYFGNSEYRGLEVLKQSVKSSFAFFGDTKHEIEDIFAKGDKVVLRVSSIKVLGSLDLAGKDQQMLESLQETLDHLKGKIA